MQATCPPPPSSTGWIVITVVLVLLILAGVGFFIWYYFRPKCPSGQTCRSTINPCPNGLSCLASANPCPTGQICRGDQPVVNLSTIATCPVCVSGKPIYIHGFVDTNDRYSDVSNADGVMTQDGTDIMLRQTVTGGLNQTWMVEIDNPNAAIFEYYLKNATTAQYLTNTSGTALGVTADKSSGAKFRILPVANRQGRTYVFRTQTNDLAVGNDLRVILVNAATDTEVPNNAEWMTTSTNGN